jgi:hypothetical protein
MSYWCHGVIIVPRCQADSDHDASVTVVPVTVRLRSSDHDSARDDHHSSCPGVANSVPVTRTGLGLVSGPSAAGRPIMQWPGRHGRTVTVATSTSKILYVTRDTSLHLKGLQGPKVLLESQPVSEQVSFIYLVQKNERSC